MRVFRHLVAVVLLGVFVNTPWASAAEPRSGVRQAQGIAWSTPNPLDSLRNLLVSFWSTLGLGASNKTGCDIDPLGRCITAPGSSGPGSSSLQAPEEAPIKTPM
jgi:hypothetical protein